MPIYEYECSECSEFTTVERKMSQYDVPPDDGCQKCKSKNIKRVIREWKAGQFIKPWGGKAAWHNEEYLGNKPIR